MAATLFNKLQPIEVGAVGARGSFISREGDGEPLEASCSAHLESM